MGFGKGQGDNYQSKRTPFILRGLDIMHPVDNLELGYYSYLKNVRAYVDGEIQTRPGITLIKDLNGVVDGQINSIIYFPDPTINDFCYIVGTTAGKLYHITSGLVATLILSGLSGKRLTHLIARPDRSPKPYLYLGDANLTKKVKVDGTVQNSGIESLPAVPTVRPEPPSSLLVSDFTSAAPEATPEQGNVWNKSVYATTLTQINRTNTTINKILYDSDGSNYCCIAPALFDNSIAFHQRLQIGSVPAANNEYVIVEQITNAIPSTTLESIIYDSGNTGPFTAVLVANSIDLVPNSLLEINGELIRVEAVIQGPNDKFAFKGRSTTTLAATNAVTGYKSFRARTVNVHSPGEPILCTGYGAEISGGPATVPFWGNIRHNIARDWSNVSGKPIKDDDEVTIGIYTDSPKDTVAVRIWVDVDQATTTAYVADDMSKNYYMLEFRMSDLEQFARYDSANTQLGTTFGRIQRDEFDRFNYAEVARDRELSLKRSQVAALGGPKSLFGRLLQKSYFPPTPSKTKNSLGEVNSGVGQWYQLRFPIGLLKENRVGTDVSKTLKDIKSVMVNFLVAGGSTVNVGISSWWVGSGSGPSTLAIGATKETNGYFYLTQARNRETGDISLPSPPTRTGVIGLRQRMILSVPMHSDAQVTNIDIYRYGGTLFNWYYLGTVPNTPGGGNVQFIDDIPDERIQFNKLLIPDSYAPFPTSDLPRKGRCDVVGSVVTRLTGAGNDDFNTKWAPGNSIIIDGKPFIIFQSPSSAARLELSESAGTLTNVEWEMNSPLLLATHLPTIIGPYSSANYGLTYFAVGDPLNPGIMYWARGNNPGTANETGYYEVCQPSEPLIGGLLYDQRIYLYSSEKCYMVVEDGRGGFATQEVANSKGAVSPHGLGSGTLQFHVGKDGIYVAEGGQPRSITDDRLYKLFPHDGQTGLNTSNIPAPDYLRDDEFQFAITGDGLYFIYPTTSPFLDFEWNLLRYDFGLQAWTYDNHSNHGVCAIHYPKGDGIYQILVATVNGALGYLGGVSDLGTPIQSIVHAPPVSGPNERALARFGDLTVQLNTNNSDCSIIPYINNYEQSLSSSLVRSSNRAEKIVELLGGAENFARNLGIAIQHDGLDVNGNPSQLKLYEWQVALIDKPEISILRATDWQKVRPDGSGFVQGIHIEADTYGANFPFRVEYDGGQLGALLTINHNGQFEGDYSFDQPFEAHLVRIRPVDTALEWRLFNIEWISEPTPADALVWETQPTDHGICGWKHVPGAYVTLAAEELVYLTITIDGVDYLYPITPTGGDKAKKYLRLQPKKGKIYSYRFHSESEFQLFVQESCVFVGAWGRGLEQPYVVDKPFGGMSRQNGAVI